MCCMDHQGEKKKAAFRSEDKDEIRRVPEGQAQEVDEAKLQQNNVREVWSGMKQKTGFRVGGRRPTS